MTQPTRPTRRRLISLAALAAVGLAGLSCGDSGQEATADGTGGGKAGSGLTVGFSQVGAENAWRTANTNDIQAAAKERGIDLRFSDAQQKQDNQIKAIQNFIAQGVDVIAFSPIVKTGWDPVLREAKAAGIPVVTSDRRAEVSDPTLIASFVGGDFEKEGRIAGEEMARITGGKATIVELEGTPGADPSILRKKGFHEAIAAFPGMKVIKEQTGDFTRAGGREVMEAFLNSSEGPQIDALYAHNDDMALGAIQAIEAKGKKPGTDVKIVSIDAVTGALEAVDAGTLNATVECSPLLGAPLFDVVAKVAKGESVPAEVISDPVVFTKENAAAAIPGRPF